ncbi:2182_t:CDS:10 [Paraglomus brasilianum]|uniref:Dol-P-Glc:Glc(2)Man(9)GlcNAc(2)-PP-Dol alpha-1,2-glucosyltransferase n=1 Tax=Paraglomus brasilianum TaxID=144538 RepID=A0A9N9G291_9GLOM|nr:2182_t:CDS:10 [Paraglomus brasilianum]
MLSLASWIPLIVHACILGIVFYAVNRVVPDAYMDEIFHVPQAQRYCNGDYYTWDPKLTTPPGFASIFTFHILFHSISPNDLFTIYDNALLPTSTPSPLSPSIRISIFIADDNGIDSFFVLAGYYLERVGKYGPSAMCLAISILFRQTNVIWACFVAGDIVSSILSPVIFSSPSSERDSPASSQEYSFIERWIKVAEKIVSGIQSNLKILVRRMIPYFVVVLLVGVFFVWNGSIALGDKANHVAILHIPQIYYFIAFTAVLSLPLTMIHPSDLYNLRKCLITPIAYVTMLLMTISVHKYTYEHPFLSSDNRHYSFYVWKKVYKRHPSVKYLLIPAYFTALQIILRPLTACRSSLWVLTFAAAVCLTLVPSPLFEFRYFIIPYIIYRLNIRPPSTTRLLLEFMTYSFVNAVTLYLFIYKPFKWESEPNQLQRFLW